MIYDHWNHSHVPSKKPPHLLYTHYKARHEFLTSSPNNRSIRDKTQMNRINCMQLTSPKMHLSKPIHDWLRPRRIVPYRTIMYAFFQQTRPNYGYMSQFCKQYHDRIYSVCLPRRDQSIVFKLGPCNRHLGAFAERCINNRKLRHDTKGRSRSCIVFEKCTFEEVSYIIIGIWPVGRLLKWDLGVVPAITYHCNAVFVHLYCICTENRDNHSFSFGNGKRGTRYLMYNFVSFTFLTKTQAIFLFKWFAYYLSWH